MQAKYFNISAVILELRCYFFFDVKKLWSRKVPFDSRVPPTLNADQLLPPLSPVCAVCTPGT